MSIEQLFFIALFVAIAIFNLLRQARSRRRAPDDTDGAPPAEPGPARIPPRVVIARPPSPVVTRRPAADLPGATAAPPERRRRGRRRLRNRRDARRGIVLITVLGPCRGLEPLAPPESPAAIAPR
ncbi:MAG TPA: hypothetical protein VFV05_22180 [Methylomirabilota bacterium]|nr:hypothetical protein [Methylomirabilota bacterium]